MTKLMTSGIVVNLHSQDSSQDHRIDGESRRGSRTSKIMTAVL